MSLAAPQKSGPQVTDAPGYSQAPVASQAVAPQPPSLVTQALVQQFPLPSTPQTWDMHSESAEHCTPSSNGLPVLEPPVVTSPPEVPVEPVEVPLAPLALPPPPHAAAKSKAPVIISPKRTRRSSTPVTE